MAEEKRKPYLEEYESSDLGFGSLVSSQPDLRLLNRDGSFNVVKPRVQRLQSFASYHRLLTMTWPRFFAVLLCGYFSINVAFAGAYYLLGPKALQGDLQTPTFLRDFFFSIDVFSTIGFGTVTPAGVAGNLLVAIETLVALLAFALSTGLVFARFSRPVAEIIYAKRAVIAPYRDIRAFEFRIVNARENQLIEVHATVVFSRFEAVGNRRQRVYSRLSLEREMVTFFPLSWTIVHPIDSDSPLQDWTKQKLLDANAEFLVLITAIDETFAQTVHSRNSYTANEVEWNARFAPMFRDVRGAMELDISRLDALIQLSSQAAADD